MTETIHVAEPATDISDFEGFDKPRWSQIPNKIFDSIGPSLKSGSQAWILAWIARETFGWHRRTTTISITKISQGTGLSDGCVKECLKALASRGLIVVVAGAPIKNGRGFTPNTYSLKMRAGGRADSAPGGVGREMPQGGAESDQGGGAEFDSSIRNKDILFKDNTLEEDSPVLQTEEEPPETQRPDLQLDEDVLKFVRNAYSQSRGAKTNSAAIRKDSYRIEAFEDSLGPEVFRSALWSFLGTSDDWLRANKWPLPAFLKNLARYTEKYDEPFRPPVARADLTGIQEELPGTEPPSPPVDRPTPAAIAARWDELVPKRASQFTPVGGWKSQCFTEPGFLAAMDDVFRKAAQLIDGDPDASWLSFRWVIAAKDGIFNWQKIADGSMDFMLAKNKKPGVQSEADAKSLAARTLARIKSRSKESIAV